MASQSIIVTFNEDLPVGANLSIKVNTYFDIGKRFVAQRTATGEATVGTPTAIVGEISAINYEIALSLDANSFFPYVVSRVDNVVTITFDNGIILDSYSCTNGIWSEWIGWTVPDGEDLVFYSVSVVADGVFVPPVDVTEYYNVPNFDTVNIDIVDTYVNERVLILEKAEINSIKLEWLGADDLFQNIMPSKLLFSMLVPDASDGIFSHLFTEDERRYKVLVNVKNGDGEFEIFWQGFLLAEQFSEPYENGNFFVSFVAVDGLGLLKNKFLPNDYYNGVKSIAYVLSKCLEQTGLNLDIWHAKSYVNSYDTSITLSDICVRTSVYATGSNRQDVYKILESLLVYLGCKLFLIADKWMLVGLNRFSDNSMMCDVYNSYGTFVREREVKLKSVEAVFQYSPIIEMQPKLNTVIVANSFSTGSLLDKKSVYQKLEYVVYGFNNVLKVNYFKLIGSGFYLGLALVKNYHNNSVDFRKVLNDEQINFDDFKLLQEEFGISSSVLNLLVQGGSPDINANYIVSDRMYVESYEFSKTVLSLNIRLMTQFMGVASGTISQSEFNYTYKYEIRLDGVVISTNNINDNEFSLDLGAFGIVRGSVSVDDIEVPHAGYVELVVKIRDTCGGNPVNYTIFDTIELKSETKVSEKESYELQRDNKYSETMDISLDYTDSVNDVFADRRIIFRENYILGSVSVVKPSLLHQVEFTNYQVNSSTMWCNASINHEDYRLLRENVDYIYVKRNGVMILRSFITSMFEVMQGFSVNWLMVGISPTNTETEYRFLETDEIWIDRPEIVEQITDKNMVLDKWQDYVFSENKKLRVGEVLGMMYHNLTYKSKYKISGNLFGLVTPLDLLAFSYMDNDINFLPTRLSLDLTDGMTNIVMIENKQENVEDYVS